MQYKGKKYKDTYVKTPVVFQLEATECGAASLAMILGYHGRFVPLEKLRIDCGVSRNGSSARNVILGAAGYNLKGRGFRKEIEALLASRAPSILHWSFNHFVVYEGIRGDHIYINDPAEGRRRISIEELDENFTGVVLEFEKEDGFFREREQKTIAASIRDRSKNDKASILYLILTGLLLILPGIVLAVLSKIFVDEVLLGDKLNWVPGIIAGMVMAAIFQVFLHYAQNRFLLKLQTKLAIVSSTVFLRKLLRLPIQFFDQRYAGDISGRIRDNEKVADFLAGDLAVTILSLITAAFYLLLMMIYNWKLTLIGLVLILIEIAVLRSRTEHIASSKMKMEQDSGKLDGMIYSGLRVMQSLKAAGSENAYASRLLGHYARVCRNDQVLGSFRQYMTAIPSAARQITNVFILLIGGIDVIEGRMSIGMLIAFTALMNSFITPVNAFIGFGEKIQDLKAHIHRLDDINDYEQDERYKQRQEIRTDKTRLDGSVRIENLVFGYNNLEDPLISELDLSLKPGQSAAFVGASGSGKSTITKLVSGLYMPWSGQILLDGYEHSRLPLELLNTSIAVVDQDIMLFSGSIRDNITLWDQSVDGSDLIRAAKDACIHDEITAKPGSYDYMLTEGGRNLSGGQRQRLEIARALVLDPAVLILDEATSALDTQTEKNIMDNIRRRGCTCIIVAHRLSAIRDCDEIIVLDKGVPVQRGTHETLKERSGSYAQLIALN